MKDQLRAAFTEMFDKLESWLKALITHLPNILVALIVFALTIIIARWIRRLIRKSMRRTPATESVGNLMASIGSVVTVIIGLFLILAVLNLDGAATGLLAGASISGLVIGLALQNTFVNTFGGVVMSLRNDISIGDSIESNGYAGVVQRITLRNTMIKLADNNVVFIPNKEVLENPFKNLSRTTTTRVELTCGIAYDTDLIKARDLTIATLSGAFDGAVEKGIDFQYTEFGSSAINFVVWFWIDATSAVQVREAKSQAIIALKAAFDLAGINIPYPIITIQSPST